MTDIAAQIRQEITRLQRALTALEGTSGGEVGNGRRQRGRRKLSAKARKAISDAQKRRWANKKAGKS